MRTKAKTWPRNSISLPIQQLFIWTRKTRFWRTDVTAFRRRSLCRKDKTIEQPRKEELDTLDILDGKTRDAFSGKVGPLLARDRCLTDWQIILFSGLFAGYIGFSLDAGYKWLRKKDGNRLSKLNRNCRSMVAIIKMAPDMVRKTRRLLQS